MPHGERATFVEEGDEGRRRLAELRDRIEASPYPSRRYADAIALGDQVLADLTALVESLYPDPNPPDPLTRAASIQRTYGASRFTAFVERPQQAALLDRFADGQAPPLLVTGPPGIGASALVTHWAASLGRSSADATRAIGSSCTTWRPTATPPTTDRWSAGSSPSWPAHTTSSDSRPTRRTMRRHCGACSARRSPNRTVER